MSRAIRIAQGLITPHRYPQGRALTADELERAGYRDAAASKRYRESDPWDQRDWGGTFG